jgi:hypothetical protein
MPVMMSLKWDGVTAKQYDEVCKAVNWEGDKPAGGLFHAAAITEQGLEVTDLWETAEQFNRFVEDRLMPGVQQVGIKGQPQVQMHPVHALFTPGFKRV